MKRITFLFVCLLFVTASWAQNIQVSGVVTDVADGQPIAGVAVTVKDAKNYVTTDLDGKYTISVSANATLVFVSMGMVTQEVPVGGRSLINVSLENDTQRLDEVLIVSPYGTGRKPGSIVGSVTQVTAKKLEAKPVANVLDGLQGRVAGMQVFTSSGEPSALPSMRIHGVGSLTAGNTPLYVVDGVAIPVETMLTLNANDFESVNVLKDASATAIYGARAANGVVFIITKRGKAGDARIIARAQYGVSALADQAFDVMDSKQLLDLQLKYGIANMTQEKYNQLLGTGINTKWYDWYFNSSAPTYQADIAIQGGTEKSKYYVSGAYFFQDGLTTRSEFERYSFRSNLEVTPKKWLRMGVNASGAYTLTQVDGYTYQASNNSYGGIMWSNSTPSYYSPYDENGNEKDYFDELSMYNPKYLLKEQPSVTNRINITGNAFAEITPFKGLTIKSLIGLDLTDNRSSSKRYPTAAFSLDNGRVYESYSRWPTLTTTNTIEYKFDINAKHNFTVLAGQEGIKYNGDGFNMSTTGQTDSRLMLLTTGPTREAPGHSTSDYAFLSFFGAVSYGFSDKYFLDLSIRNDASSRFGKDRRNGMFYSVGGMWNMKKESFMAGIQPVSALSLKVSFGTTGNASIGNYEHLAVIAATSKYNSETAWGLGSPGNSELGWETQALLTIALKTELWNRLRFEFEFYNRQSLDMLMDVPFPYTAGFADVRSNIGSMANRGIDITLGVDIVRTKDLLVEFNTTFSYNKNKITDLFYGYEEWIVPNTFVGYVVGRPVEFYMPVYAGVNSSNGKQLWKIPGTNDVTETYVQGDLQQMTGKPRYAPYNGGFELSANWKGIYASAFFSWVGEKYLWNNDRFFNENNNFLSQGDNQSVAMLRMWEKPGDVTDIPKYGENAQMDTRQLENASFMRLKNLTVGYVLPTNLLQYTKFFSGAKIYFTARNLLTWTNYLGADPEIDSNLTYGAYPNTRQFTCGIELTF